MYKIIYIKHFSQYESFNKTAAYSKILWTLTQLNKYYVHYLNM